MRDGEAGLVKLRNTLSDVDNQMVEAQARPAASPRISITTKP